ncbi:hypothetical protein ACSBM8_02325 [Sphingomonas sp. ASY06-1R]|jgi:hypothetical protein|uniref:hypothetical protein n=1 Tax=Sphingomonas sp. ASY06-1R TaxID=3445771 RepID=UPI003FA296D7
MSISPILPPKSEGRSENDVRRAALGDLHEGAARRNPAESTGEGPWVASRARPQKRGISLLAWGIAALVSLGLWAAILFLIR